MSALKPQKILGWPRRKRAFSLLEMVVVIAILAILAAVAVRSLSGVEDQSRFDATRTQLTNISNAIVGESNPATSDTSSAVFSFVNDIGRLPEAYLSELWENPNSLPALSPQQATTFDPDVWITSGWRSGGYLQLGVGQSALTDGWGNPYDLLHADGITPCATGDPVEVIRSKGAGGQNDTPTSTGFDAYQYVVLNSTVTLGSIPPTNRYQATVSGSVYFYDPTTGQIETPNSANGNVIVALFQPDMSATGAANNYISCQYVTCTPSSTGAFTYSFPSSATIPPNVPVTVGQRVLRAYQWAGSGMPSVVGMTQAYRSIPVRVTIVPGAQIKDLTLLQPTTQPTSNQ